MMQTNYRVPGVYLEQIFPTPTPEFTTGVPAFLGLTKDKDGKGNDIPCYIPQLVTLWPQFGQFFGEPLPDSYLSDAVRGFFENGGRMCYVVRLKDRTREALSQGLSAIELLNTIDLICTPDLMERETNPDPLVVQQLQTTVLEHCQLRGDRFAILDTPKVSSFDDTKQQRQRLSSNNGALYFPWLKVDGNTNCVPPCGHVAGIYASSDRRFGISRAPANYVIEGVLDLSCDLSDANLVDATQMGINCLRGLPGRGIRVWGAYTLSSDQNWRYINVRRLFLTISRWVELNLADVVFEPNDYRLWIRIQRELTAYCESLFQQGALKGTSPEEAFYVKCDVQTNPSGVQEAGMVVTEIGLAPIVPNEFIAVRLIQGEAGVTLLDSISP